MAEFTKIVGFNDDKILEPYTGPSLFVNGSYTVQKLQESKAFPMEKEKIRDIYKPLFPDCTAVIVEGAGHFVHIDKPAQVCSLIKDFLDSVDKSD